MEALSKAFLKQRPCGFAKACRPLLFLSGGTVAMIEELGDEPEERALFGKVGGNWRFFSCFDGGGGGDGGEALCQRLHHLMERIGDDALFRVGEFLTPCEAQAKPKRSPSGVQGGGGMALE